MSRRRTTGAARAAERRVENIDMFLGVLGFFTISLLVSTAWAELHGDPSLGRALTLAVFVALVALVLRARRTLAQRRDALVGSRGTVGGSTRNG